MELKYFQAFYDISLKLGIAVHAEKNSAIEALLLKRDHIIIRVKDCEKKIKILKQNRPILIATKKYNDRIQSFNEKIKEIADKIVPIEKANAKILVEQKNLTKERIYVLRKGKALLAGYGGQKFLGPRFVNYKIH